MCHIRTHTSAILKEYYVSRLRQHQAGFLAQYTQEARVILEELLDKYSDHGLAQFTTSDVLKVPPLSDHGNVSEIAHLFGGADRLKDAITQLQTLLYAA
jgi:type I restriction enzyme R subunit